MEARSDAPSRANPVVTFAVFLLLGPLFGYLAFSIVIGLWGTLQDGRAGLLLAGPAVFIVSAPFGLSLAFVLGWKAAITAGFGMAAYDAMGWPQRWRRLAAAILGASLAFAWERGRNGSKPMAEIWPDLVMFATAGAIAAVASATLAAYFSRVGGGDVGERP